MPTRVGERVGLAGGPRLHVYLQRLSWCKHLARPRVRLQLLFLLLLLLLLQSVEAVADRVGGASLEHLLDPRKQASKGECTPLDWLAGWLAD